ncbi:MAG TPA: hypothetical protein VLX59_12470 [Acidimicrobiales bacterium]|nr:hypothetical protein [Acidimicrobiales bacterium]
MDPVELLEHDHRLVEQLFRNYGPALAARGRQLEAAEKAAPAAPARPHPAAPDRPPLLTVAAPFVSVFDRARDRQQGRPAT